MGTSTASMRWARKYSLNTSGVRTCAIGSAIMANKRVFPVITLELLQRRFIHQVQVSIQAARLESGPKEGCPGRGAATTGSAAPGDPKLSDAAHAQILHNEVVIKTVM